MKDSTKKEQVLADGVTIEPYSPDVCLSDADGNLIEETQGHAFRLVVDPDKEGYLDRDEMFSLVVDITDLEFPADKAAFKRIEEAADQLQKLAREVRLSYFRRTGDIGPPPEASDFLKKYNEEWGPEVVPGVRIKPAPYVHEVDDDGNEIPGSRGHYHYVEFQCKELEEAGNLFSFVDSIDDREGPTVNDAAAKRLIAASDQLRQAAFELSPHTSAELSRLMVEITEPGRPPHRIQFKDPRLSFVERHNRSAHDGSTARVLLNPGPEIVPDLSFAGDQSRRIDPSHKQPQAKQTTQGTPGENQRDLEAILAATPTEETRPAYLEVTEPGKKTILAKFPDPRESFSLEYERLNQGSQCRPIQEPAVPVEPSLDFTPGGQTVTERVPEADQPQK